MSILDIAREIMDDTRDADTKTRVYSSRYPEFYKSYPVLAKSVSTDPLFDMRTLEYMCEKRRSADTYSASVDVGQHVYDKYIGSKIK